VYQLAITEKPTYLHVVVTGRNGRETIARYFDEVMRTSRERNCPRLLIEERLEGPRLGTVDTFALVSCGSMRYMGLVKSIAYVDAHAVDDIMSFAENVAVNRAFPARVFKDVATAERWLCGEHQRCAAAHATPAPAAQTASGRGNH